MQCRSKPKFEESEGQFININYQKTVNNYLIRALYYAIMFRPMIKVGVKKKEIRKFEKYGFISTNFGIFSDQLAVGLSLISVPLMILI